MICYHAEQRFETAAPQIATTAKKIFDESYNIRIE
jgi:hypothetical protein